MAAKTTRKKPDFNGVPGRLVDPPANLQFGEKKRTSPYDILLEQMAASNGKALEFPDLRAKTSVMVRARKLRMKVQLAESGNTLYVKFAGWLPDSDRWKALLRDGILDAIKTQPRNEIQIATAIRARGLNDVDAGTVGAVLKQMEQGGTVSRDRDGSWKPKP